jgi:hypothetical protein
MLPPRLLVAAFLVFGFIGCKTLDSSPTPAPAGSGIRLSDADAAAIGRKIWQNECAGTVEGLTTWNAGEDFPSLGIGHFIWYVDGRPGPFQESFPPLIAYMQQKGMSVPGSVASAKGSPWKSRSEFLAAQSSPQMKEIRQFLANTVPVQTGFIVQRLEQALPKMQGATSGEADKARLRENFYKMAESRTGLYALIDYVNFKGEGVKEEEKYEGQGWGLRDVLLEMGSTAGGQASANEFSEAAKRVLQRRIKNSPAERGESRWSAGWMNRCETYKHGI